MYAVFKFKGEDPKIREIYTDDLIARQTIVKRDSKSLGIQEEGLYLLIEGSEEAVERAKEILSDFLLTGEDGERIYRLIKKGDEEASIGMGAIFG